MAALVEAYPESGFEDLLRIRTPSFATRNPKLLQLYEKYRLRMGQRGMTFVQMAVRQVREILGSEPRGLAIDLGCGVGAGALPLSEQFDAVIGIDPSLPDLILARKALEEQRVGNVTLVAGFAQRLPVCDRCAGFVLAENVLEHIHELDEACREIGRVLAPGSVFVGDCVNRYSLLRPEPHVKLWAVGYLPRAWQARYVKRRRDFDGYDRSVHLRSLRELQRAVRAIGPEGRVGFPSFSAYGYPAFADRVLDTIRRIPILSTALLWIFPAFLVVAPRAR
ncbi:MAG TPA: class I SAM-dependent methyltransferase [Gemmatimonadota bacterium]|nr:class I SAM-dependent methyltransferase [Gemmatimonadota bacterium]